MTARALGSLQVVDDALMDRLREEARRAEGRRAVHLFHRAEDLVQRKLVAIEPESYVRPHDHSATGKMEAFIALRGRAAVVTFDSGGGVAGAILIAARGGARGVEIPPDTVHMVVSLEAGTVLYEVSLGPYDPATHKQYAPWAPAEGTGQGPEYVAAIRRQLGL